MGVSASTDPGAPLVMDFLSSKQGSFTPIEAPGISMGPFEVPAAGISLGGAAYVSVITNYTPDKNAYKAMLLQFDEASHDFTSIRELSHLPGGHFIKMTLRQAPGTLAGLPTPEDYVLMFGCDQYRASTAYLAAIPSQTFTTGDGTRYFAGLTGNQPQWSEKESDRTPVVTHPTIGDLSVAFVQQLGLWIMLCDSRDPKGIILRYAAKPWGPWSDPVIVFEAMRDKGGAFIHIPRPGTDDGLDGPITGGGDASQVAGAAYAPYIIERFSQVQGKDLAIHYLTSTWNPYTVVRMRSTLSIQG